VGSLRHAIQRVWCAVGISGPAYLQLYRGAARRDPRGPPGRSTALHSTRQLAGSLELSLKHGCSDALRAADRADGLLCGRRDTAAARSSPSRSSASNPRLRPVAEQRAIQVGAQGPADARPPLLRNPTRRESRALAPVAVRLSVSGVPDPSLFPIQDWRNDGLFVGGSRSASIRASKRTAGYDPPAGGVGAAPLSSRRGPHREAPRRGCVTSSSDRDRERCAAGIRFCSRARSPRAGRSGLVEDPGLPGGYAHPGGGRRRAVR